MSDTRALELHAREVQLFNLKKGVDWNDAESIRDYNKTVAELRETWKAEDAEAGIEDEPKGKKLPRAGAGAPKPVEKTLSVQEQKALGARIAKHFNNGQQEED